MYKNILPQRTSKSSGIGQNYQNLAYCPVTTAEVWVNDEATFLIPGGQANWWHCSACHGWHILIIDNDKKVKNHF